MGYQVLDVTPDSPEWYEKRRGGLGASDSAAILGLTSSGWATPLSVYESKFGVEREFDPMLSFVGHELEPFISKWIAEFHPEVPRLDSGFAAQSTEWPWLFATPDRVVHDLGFVCPVELKSSNPHMKKSWADGVPIAYLCQVQHQIAVLNAPYGYLAVYHGGTDFELHRIQRDDKFIREYLVPRTQEFWENHVLAQVPPEPVTSQEAVSLWPGEPELAIEGDEDLLDVHALYGQEQANEIAAREAKEAIALQLQIAMGDATTLTHNGTPLFTWKPRKGSTRLDTAALKAEHPELHARYMKQGGPTRTFIRKKVETP